MIRPHPRGAGRARWWALLLAALAVRLLVPVGYMPGAGGFVACPDQGPVAHAGAMAHAGHGHQGHGDDGHAAHRTCAFALAAAPALGGADPVLPAAPPAHDAMAPAAYHRAAPAPARADERPPARAPPSGRSALLA